MKGGSVRILLASALLGLTASCAWPPPPAEVAAPAAPPPAPVALMAPAPPAPAPIVATPQAPPAAGPVLAFPFARNLGWLTPLPGRLTLNNFAFDRAHVQMLITPYPDCAAREGTATGDFVLPLNGTRIIEAAAGSDVCWRREIQPTGGAAANVPGWTEWNRVYLTAGHSIDSQL
jgi:hypothetical protein